MMIASNIAGLNGNDALVVPLPVKPETQEVQQTLPKENKNSPQRGMSVEEYVKSYFSDIPVMVEIARCESRFRQYDKSGGVLRGEENNLDRGVMQINEYYHNQIAEKLGFDILTLEGNTAYARYLFEKYGVRPWKSSSPCWARTIAYSEYKELSLNK